jgi:hypothetical protein
MAELETPKWIIELDVDHYAGHVYLEGEVHLIKPGSEGRCGCKPTLTMFWKDHVGPIGIYCHRTEQQRQEDEK